MKCDLDKITNVYNKIISRTSGIVIMYCYYSLAESHITLLVPFISIKSNKNLASVLDNYVKILACKHQITYILLKMIKC